MAIQFTKNLEQFTTTQKVTRAKYFTEYASKKQLENAGVLAQEELEFAKSIKATFSFSLHEGLRYMAVTLYKATAETKYHFLIVDLKEKAVAEVNSIKEAKTAILEQVQEDLKVAEETAITQEPEAEALAEEDVEEIASRALARQLEEMFEEDEKSK